MNDYDILVVGAGPAGLTAALYAQRAGYRTLVLEEFVYGGQMANTPEVENYPAVGKISGADLGINLYNQAIEQGAIVQFDGIIEAKLTGKVKELTTQSGKRYTAGAVIIANGAKRRKIGIPGEEAYAGRGVSYCATCDGGFYKGKTTAVIGGGNTAVEDAIYLANICKKVYLVHRRDAFRASPVLVNALARRDNITVCFDTQPLEILSSSDAQRVASLTVKSTKTGARGSITADGIFIAIGLIPDNAIFSGALTLDKTGYILAGEDTRTNLPGVFAAGDTRTKALRQIVTAASDGAIAAFEAGAYLQE